MTIVAGTALEAPDLPEEREADRKLSVASPWTLVWWRFRKHKIALGASVLVIMYYLTAVFCEFVAPTDPNAINGTFRYVQPQGISFHDAQGHFSLIPGVYGLALHRDSVTLQLTYTTDKTKWFPLQLFAQGTPYQLWNVIPWDRHLISLGPNNSDQAFYLLGSDKLGRDMLSRVVYASRVSLSLGLIGVALSLLLGVILGGISGYYGGGPDLLIQRIIEFVRSMPTIPLWLALSAILPPTWSPLLVYFGITCILSLLNWTRLAREVRGRFAQLRDEDFVMAARFAGASEPRIIFRHMVPSFTSHIIAITTLAIPGMILGETALSFLGLGLRSPIVSWGVLLQDAQSVQTVSLYPWLLVPALSVVVVILAFNFMGDGLRDAADPYAR